MPMPIYVYAQHLISSLSAACVFEPELWLALRLEAGRLLQSGPVFAVQRLRLRLRLGAKAP